MQVQRLQCSSPPCPLQREPHTLSSLLLSCQSLPPAAEVVRWARAPCFLPLHSEPAQEGSRILPRTSVWLPGLLGAEEERLARTCQSPWPPACFSPRKSLVAHMPLHGLVHHGLPGAFCPPLVFLEDSGSTSGFWKPESFFPLLLSHSCFPLNKQLSELY